MKISDFYKKGVHNIYRDEPAIDANVSGHINQNLGYNGSGSNVPPLEELPE